VDEQLAFGLLRQQFVPVCFAKAWKSRTDPGSWRRSQHLAAGEFGSAFLARRIGNGQFRPWCRVPCPKAIAATFGCSEDRRGSGRRRSKSTGRPRVCGEAHSGQRCRASLFLRFFGGGFLGIGPARAADRVGGAAIALPVSFAARPSRPPRCRPPPRPPTRQRRPRSPPRSPRWQRPAARRRGRVAAARRRRRGHNLDSAQPLTLASALGSAAASVPPAIAHVGTTTALAATCWATKLTSFAGRELRGCIGGHAGGQLHLAAIDRSQHDRRRLQPALQLSRVSRRLFASAPSRGGGQHLDALDGRSPARRDRPLAGGELPFRRDSSSPAPAGSPSLADLGRHLGRRRLQAAAISASCASSFCTQATAPAPVTGSDAAHARRRRRPRRRI